MKKQKGLLLLCMALSVSYNLFGQCGSIPVAITNYCPNQYAEFDIANSDPTVKYHWYKIGGTPVDTTDYGYGNHYISPAPYPSGYGPVDFWVVKEQAAMGGPVAADPVLASALTVTQATAPYSLNINADVGFTLNYVTVPVQIYYAGTTIFRLKVSIDGKYSSWFYFTAADLIATSNAQIFFVKVPLKDALGKIGIDVLAGTNKTIRLYTEADGTEQAGTNKVDNFVWMLPSNFAPSYVIGPAPGSQITIDPLSNPQNIYSSGNKVAGFFDWDVTLKCPWQKVTAQEETDMSKCCTPVSAASILATSSGSTVVEPPFSLTLNASGNPASYTYEWFKNGVPIFGRQGVGLTSIPVTDVGKYSVRVVEKSADINKFSCYKESLLWVQKRILFAQADKQSICLGEKVNLVAKGATGPVNWTPATWIDDPASDKTTATPQSTIVYTVEAEVPLGNQVINGDFEQKNTGFTASPYYGYLDPSSATAAPAWADPYRPELDFTNGKYTINDFVFFPGYNAWRPCADHTTGTGNFLYTDAATTNQIPAGTDPTSTYVWGQDVIVEPNQDYEFSAWIMNINTQADPSSPDYQASNTLPKVMIYVDGEPLLPAAPALSGETCLWEKVSSVWNSGSKSGTVKLKVVELSHSNYGNDWALDDVAFGAPGTQTDTVQISVHDCSQISASETLHCQGDSSQITAETNGLFQGWQELGGGTGSIDAPADVVTWVKPSGVTKYVASAKFLLGNQIINGDFELGNQSFTSDYTYANPVNAGQYGVGTNAQLFDPTYFVSKKDHTSGFGNMFVSDGGSDPTKSPYKTTVDVVAGTQYAFSAWAANIHLEFAKVNPDTAYNAKTTNLEFVVDGTALGNIKLPLDTAWHQFYALWTAPSTGTVNIQIRNRETSNSGNDFVLDDIVFAPLMPGIKYDTITVVPCKFEAKDTAVAFCESVKGSGLVSDIDLTLYNNTVINGDANASVLSWHTALPASAANKVADPSNVSVADGAKVYAVVTNAFLAGDTAVVSFTVSTLPAVSLPAISEACIHAPAFSITGMTPTGGTFKGMGVNAAGLFTPSAVGTFPITYVYTDAAGCTDSVTQSVKVKSLPIIDSIVSNTPYCSGGAVKLDLTVTAGPNVTYSWIGPESFVSTTEDPVINNATATKTGKYKVTVTDSACIALDSISIVVNETPKLVVNNLAAVCAPSTVDISASAVLNTATSTLPTGIVYTYLKADSTGITGQTALADSGIYYIVGTAGTCADTAMLTAIIKSKPTITYPVTSPLDTALCAGESLTLHASATSTGSLAYSWIGPNGFTSNNQNPLVNSIASTSNTGEYRLIAEDKGCTDTSIIAVTVHPLPSPVIQTLSPGCEGASFTAHLFSTANSSFIWKVTGTGTTVIPSTADSIQFTVGTGDVSVSVIEKTTFGCMDTAATETIPVSLKPTKAQVTKDSLGICIAEVNNLNGNNPVVGTGVWSLLSSLGASSTAVVNPGNSGTGQIENVQEGEILTAIWTISNGVCPPAKDTVIVTGGGVSAPVVSLTSDKQQICAGETVLFTASASGGGSNPLYTFFDKQGNVLQAQSSDNTLSLTLTQDTIVFVELTSNSSCLGSNPATVQSLYDTIVVDKKPSFANILTNTQAICNDSIELNATPLTTGKGSWSVYSGDNGSFSLITSAATVLRNLIAGTSSRAIWTAQSELGLCLSNSDTVVITRVGSLTTPAAGADQTVCETAPSITLTGNSNYLSTETVSWTALDGGTISSPNTATSNVTSLSPGAYRFVYAIDNGLCPVKTDTVTITIDEDVSAPAFANDTIVTCANAVQLNALPVTPASAVKIWTVVQGQGVIANADKSNPKAQLSNLNTPNQFSLVEWKVSNGKCAPKADTLVVQKAGNATTPTISYDGGTYVSGNKDTVCLNSSHTLNGMAFQADENGQWKVDRTAFTYTTSSATGIDLVASAVGTSVFKWVIKKNLASCPADTGYYILTVIPNDTFAVAVSGPNSVCIGTAVSAFNATISGDGNSFKYTWNLDNFSIGTDAPTLNLTALAVGTHVIQVTATSKAVCVSNPYKESSTTATIEIVGKPDSTVIGADRFCPGKFTVLKAAPGLDYQWYRNNTILSGETNEELQVSSNQIVYVKVSDPVTGCTATSVPIDVQELALNTSSILVNPLNKTSICTGESVQLTLNITANSYEWYQDNQMLSTYSKSITAVSGGEFKVEFTLGNCVDSAKITINELPQPSPSLLSSDTTVCSGEVVYLNGISSGGTVNWFKDGIKQSGAKQLSLPVSESGSFLLEESNGVCSTKTAIVNVVVENVPQANAGPDKYTKLGEPVLLQGSGGLKAAWEPASILSNPTSLTPLAYTEAAQTVFYLRLSSTSGRCSTTDSMLVFTEFPVKPWNSFSPNGDGVYDGWIIENLESYPNASIEVYNRWGSLVWKSIGYGKRWKGENFRNGQALPLATYYYIIYPNGGSVTQPITGAVTIVK